MGLTDHAMVIIGVTVDTKVIAVTELLSRLPYCKPENFCMQPSIFVIKGENRKNSKSNALSFYF